MSAPQLAVSVGPGLLARRGSAVLFSPTFDEDLLARFVDPGVDVIETVTEAVVTDASTSPFVVIVFGPVTRIAVFGSITVFSSHPSLPALDASGAGTWIERTLRLSDDSSELSVSAGEVDAVEGGTDLVEGVVLAGGFRLKVPTEILAASDAVGAALVEPAVVEPTAPSTDVGPTETVVRPNEPSSTDVLRADLERLESAPTAESTAVVEPGEPDPVSAPDLMPQEEPTIAVDESLQETLDSLLGSRQPDPARADASWTLEFDSGDLHRVEATVVIGRQPRLDYPDAPATVRPLPMSGGKLSKTHLECTATPQGLRVRDLNSTNGSFVVPSGDGDPIHLSEGREMLLDDGAVVKVGSIKFTVQRN